MSSQDLYQQIKPLIAGFYALAISVTAGFGIQYMLISTGETVLYSHFLSYVFGSGLGMYYILTLAQNFRYREKLEEENRKELSEKVTENGQ